jgi:error-prone DNA polymerase
VLVGGYSAGESDQLRRDMAAWNSTGRIESHHERLVTRMVKNGITPEYAERIFSQIRGFGDYGFPESHAASFALIAYVTSWLRCHHPAAFACSLLNAQPMGFYAPATIVEDARRHGVEVLPIDVQRSAWDCTLEEEAVRMGLRYVKGLGSREQEALCWAPPPYRGLEDFMARTRLGKSAYLKLAEAGALESLVGGRRAASRGDGSARAPGRRNAVWALREIYGRLQDSLALGAPETAEGQPLFRALSAAEEVLWDYASSRHSARGHPIAGIRDELTQRGFPTARELNALPDGTRAHYVGMTICRQRPGTATGVTFYTLEDETGFVNLVVWRDVFERHAIVARTALLLGVRGKMQSEHGVVHLVADELWEPQIAFAAQGTTARNFH